MMSPKLRSIVEFETVYFVFAGAAYLFVASDGDALVNQVTDLINSLSDNWQGLVVVMIVLAGVAGGPPLYVLNKIINLQEKEGEANRLMQEKEGASNRAIQREVAGVTAKALDKLSDAVRQIEVAMARITK